MLQPLSLTPIGIIHTPFTDRVSAPRQSYVARDVPGTIELSPGRDFEHALSDLDGWEYLWVVYWFHLNAGWRPKVLPPRSKVKRGVFSTRSPYRPCPIGMSVVRLERVEGLTVHVRGVDMIDGTPVLDLKPYVAAADAIPEAGAGWLAQKDPVAPFEVVWSSVAEEQLAWLEGHGEGELRGAVQRVLVLGPEPHPYRRIRDEGDGALRLAVKDWRVRFRVVERCVTVERVMTGYRVGQLAGGEGPVGATAEGIGLHRGFVGRFGGEKADREAGRPGGQREGAEKRTQKR